VVTQSVDHQGQVPAIKVSKGPDLADVSVMEEVTPDPLLHALCSHDKYTRVSSGDLGVPSSVT